MSQPDPHHGRSATASEGALPTGTITFLFSDIAGSTQLLAKLGDAYHELLARHNEIVRGALAAHDGVEVSTEGDAFFAVFRSAPRAVAAAVTIQQRLDAEGWPAGEGIRVRMGLHSGEGRLGGDNYIGLDVNRAARIAAAGLGGQVLVSDATHALVSHDAPDGVSFRDLGQHRLKDLPAPEHMWQLEIGGLPQDFPPPRSLDARPHNLPTASTTLVGREHELEQIRRLHQRTRLLTLTGVGGTGKTRLALAVAHQLLDDFADGCFFVPLEDAHDRASVAVAIASAIGVREKPDRDLEESLRQYLRQRRLLLVLDNFEQVLGAAPLVADLLGSSPMLSVIVTSREALHISGEQVLDVPPLNLPDPAQALTPASLSQYAAVALFIDRARAVRPDFCVTNDNAPAVAEICARLDGLPLAIELAAARVGLLTPQAILDRLERRLPLLTGGPRDAPARQRTLRDTVAWSYDLLDDAERHLFARLSTFAGGWTIEAADEVCNPAGELGVDTFDGLASLADKSLVRPVDADGESRFRMLQVIREYAAERLHADPDGEQQIQRRHAMHFLALAETAEPELRRAELRRWQRRLLRDEDNIRSALRWATEHGAAEVGMRLAGAIWRFWLYWARLREAREWLEAVLAMPGGSEPSIARAKALTALAGVLYWQGEDERVGELYDEALAIYSRLGDERQVAEAVANSGWGAISRGDMALALERAQQALERYQALGDEGASATIRAHLAVGPFLEGHGGQLDDVLDAIHNAIAINRRAGQLHEAIDWSSVIAQAYWVAGDPAGAAGSARNALRQFHEIGNMGMYAVSIRAIAAFELAAPAGDPRRIVRLAAAAERLFDELGGQLQLMQRFGDPLADARPRLSDQEYEQAVAAGRAMTPDEAVAHALEPA